MAEEEREEKADKNINPGNEVDELAATIKKLVHEVSETNRKIEEAYEEKLRRLEAKKKLVGDEKKEEEHQESIARLKERLNELKARISNARKEGKDPFIANIILRNVNAKIKMAEVTHDSKDFEAVEKILNRAELELEEALEEEEVDVKKEIEERLISETTKKTGKVTVD